MNNVRHEYTTDYISKAMSLRQPQTTSLKILEEVVTSIPLHKNLDLKEALSIIHKKFPTCINFERDFMSLTFALATGVGKTRLMGAFIAYLYTQHDIRNFFVVAPNTTIYNKLKRDLSEPNSPKYVFKGLGCFNSAPRIITDDDYKFKRLSGFDSEVIVFVYNIDKFNKEGTNARKANEMLGDSFFNYLAGLGKLVLIMDESHHYRAERGIQALNDLKPVLGVELTATPVVTKGGKQTKFRNVVYEYSLASAIADGFTRTPYAIGRHSRSLASFSEEQMDKVMLADGLNAHEAAKLALKEYASNYGKPLVKPFMLVVCKDTDHAEKIRAYIQSADFKGGAYMNKTMVVHSKQTGKETEENMHLLLSVENPENPMEIVIHVNMLKEGWDVNNLYTIVPLRAAASEVLRVQMIGRGLRLPYGERTGNEQIDGVMLAAHDKFDALLAEALKGQSIFNAKNIISAEEMELVQIQETRQQYVFDFEQHLKDAYKQTGIQRTEKSDAMIRRATDFAESAVERVLQGNSERMILPAQEQQIVQEVSDRLGNDEEFKELYQENSKQFAEWLALETQQISRVAERKYIPIPFTSFVNSKEEELYFDDFDLDLTEFTYEPLEDNKIIAQNLKDQSIVYTMQGDALDVESVEPEKELMKILRSMPEIDYEQNSELLRKLIVTVCQHFERRFGRRGVQNIVLSFRPEIAEKMYKQMKLHEVFIPGEGREEVVTVSTTNLRQSIRHNTKVKLFEFPGGDPKLVQFEGIKKGVFSTAKFDSMPEIVFARILETSPCVVNWLRPAPTQFEIFYNHGHRYEPDFVVETEDSIYLVEVKGEDKLSDPMVLAKKARAVEYCETVSRSDHPALTKKWWYLFIPAKEIRMSSSFEQLVKMYRVTQP